MIVIGATTDKASSHLAKLQKVQQAIAYSHSAEPASWQVADYQYVSVS